MVGSNLYASPQQVTDIKDCLFYHTVELPHYGIKEGAWDLRGGMDEYLGGVNFNGKKVLELGPANGALCFEMEKQGAEVICYNLSEDYEWDAVPYSQYDYKEYIVNKKLNTKKLNNAYWLSHRVLKSKAKVVYGHIYDVPHSIGAVDIVTFGAILLHIRDPFLAMQRCTAFAKEKVIVTELLPVEDQGEPTLQFLPNFKELSYKSMWWSISPELIVRYLGVFGFEKSNITYHKQKYNGQLKKMYTVVAERTCGVTI